MMTPDKDYGQLVSDHIFIYKPRHGNVGFDTLGVEEVLKKWNLNTVNQVIDLLGLMGDSSDNIPGCPGVGEKTAIKLLDEFGSVDNLLQNTDKLKGALRTKVEENIEQIKLSYFLATIKTDVPIVFEEDAFLRKESNKEKLLSLFTELEFRSYINKMNGTTLETKKETSQMLSLFDEEFVPEAETELSETQFSTIKTVDHDYKLIRSEEEIDWLVRKLSEQKMFCFDTETTSVEAVNAQLVGLSFSMRSHEAFYVPIPENQEEAKRIVSKFRSVFEDVSIEKTGQNLKYDILVLQNYGVRVSGNLFDTMIAHYLLNPELRHGMDYLAEILLNYRTIHIDELIGVKGKNQLSMRQVSLEAICDYAAEDADITLQIREKLEPKLKENNLEELFYEIEMPLVKVLAQIERNGVLIDDFALGQSSQIMTNSILKIEREIRQIAGYDVNVSSPKQIGELLFDKLKIVDKPKKTKTGQYVTDEETLESLKNKHIVVEKILSYRGLKKLLSTYVDALPKLINSKTGKIHTSFNQAVTATGRLSSSNPNLQNIPIRDEQGKEIRKAFIASENNVFLSADYSQVELRIMAHLSKDESMIRAFQNDQDIHAATAANIYKIPIEQVTSEMRRKAKTANFGIIYGISVFGLSERLSISRQEAKELIDGYFEAFPKVKEYMQKSVEEARENGFVETIFHRKRYLPDINSRNANVRGYAERNAINAPIQGSAADIIKVAMVRIADRFEKENIQSKMILQVHDELNFDVCSCELDQVKQIIKEEMENAFSLIVPLKTDIGIGQNWLEAH